MIIKLQDLAVIDKNVMDIARTGMSDPSEPGSGVVASESIPPSVPTLSLAASSEQIILTLTAPTTKENGNALHNFSQFGIYHSTGSGIDITDDTTYDNEIIFSSATSVPFPCTVKTYFRVTAFDTFGNESDPCAEDSETPTGAGPISIDIPDDATGHVFDDSISTDGIVVGDGIIGIAFKTPGVGWVGFDRYKLEYAVDTGGGFGAWTEIKNVPRKGYVHKNLNTGYAYKYRRISWAQME